MKALYYVVYVGGLSYYFDLNELAKALDFSKGYWLVQMAYIDGGRSLRYRNYDKQKGEFVG